MPAKAGVRVTKVTRSRAAPKSSGKSKVVNLGSGTKQCPTCGKFMGNGNKSG